MLLLLSRFSHGAAESSSPASCDGLRYPTLTSTSRPREANASGWSHATRTCHSMREPDRARTWRTSRRQSTEWLSEWTAGSSWTMFSADGGIMDAGAIVAADPPRRLILRWQHQRYPELQAEGESLCTMELEPAGAAVRFSLTHTIGHEPSKLIAAVSDGWPKIISNLKSLLETGSTILQDEGEAGRHRSILQEEATSRTGGAT